MKYSGEGNVINDGRFNGDPVFLVGSDDQLLIFHSCLIYSEFQLLEFWTLSERMPRGNLVWMLLHTVLKTIFRFIYLEVLFRILVQFKKWVLKQFFPFSTANISTLVSLSCTGTLEILTRCSFETQECSSSDVWPMTRPRYTEYFLMGPTLSSQTRSSLWNFEISPSFLLQFSKYVHCKKK